MLQSMLLTALTPLNLKTEENSWENQPFATIWPEKQQKKVKEITRTIKKKPKRLRTAFSTEQIRALERTYSRCKYINTEARWELAKSLNIEEKCVKIWFQNRRMKEKRESSESDSSSESLGNETSSIPASPPPTIKFDDPKTESTYQHYHCHNPDYAYQLPTYFDPQNIYGTQTSNYSAFCNDNNMYPTQYYPMNMNPYGNAEGNGFYNQYGTDINHFWNSDPSTYYAPI